MKPQRPLRRQPQPIRVTERGGVKSADPCASTATQIRHEYSLLWPDIQHARAMIRSQEGAITPSKLRKTFRGTTLGKWADNDECAILVEAYEKPRGRVASVKGLARAILRRKTGLADATIKSYLKRTRQD
jgi:hypothetical protein